MKTIVARVTRTMQHTCKMYTAALTVWLVFWGFGEEAMLDMIPAHASRGPAYVITTHRMITINWLYSSKPVYAPLISTVAIAWEFPEAKKMQLPSIHLKRITSSMLELVVFKYSPETNTKSIDIHINVVLASRCKSSWR
mmetsp:Transcript_4951/g.7504  ORF Transcript_4951/g.7504 Transcript_4951/m.7504 type:complete len:139 (+) Transcript_4951:327-743(+)